MQCMHTVLAHNYTNSLNHYHLTYDNAEAKQKHQYYWLSMCALFYLTCKVDFEQSDLAI